MDIIQAIFALVWNFRYIIVLVLIVAVLAYLKKKGKLNKRSLISFIDRRPIVCTDEQLKQIEIALKTGDKTILNRIKGEKPKTEFAPGNDQVAILSVEKNGGEYRFDMWTAGDPGVVKHQDRGRAADLGQAQPVTIVIQNKTYVGFLVDGDRGVGLKLKLDEAILKLTTTAAEAWAFLESAKLKSYLTDSLTGRQIVLYIILGVIIGQLIFFFLKI